MLDCWESGKAEAACSGGATKPGVEFKEEVERSNSAPSHRDISWVFLDILKKLTTDGTHIWMQMCTFPTASHENDSYAIQPYMKEIYSLICTHTTSAHTGLQLNVDTYFVFKVYCTVLYTAMTDKQRQRRMRISTPVRAYTCQQSPTRSWLMLHIAVPHFHCVRGVIIKLFSRGFYKACWNGQRIINTLHWRFLSLCLSISPLPRTSQQNNKWKHRTGPLSYQLIMRLM